MSEMKIETMHMSSNPGTESNELRIVTKGQRYRNTCYQRECGSLHRDEASHRRRLGECQKMQFPIA